MKQYKLKYVRTTISFTSETDKKLRALAAERKLPLSTLANKAIEEWLATQGKDGSTT